MTFDDYWGNKDERWNGILDIKNFAREVWEAARLESELAKQGEKTMTKEEKIEKAVEAVGCGGYRDMRALVERVIDALDKEDDQPPNDIPAGTPCEFDCVNGICIGYFSRYDDGVPQFVFRKDEIGMLDCGISGHSVRELGIWDIPEQYGGPQKWAIARAYNGSENYWLMSECSFQGFKDLAGCIIERRPERI